MLFGGFADHAAAEREIRMLFDAGSNVADCRRPCSRATVRAVVVFALPADQRRQRQRVVARVADHAAGRLEAKPEMVGICRQAFFSVGP